MPRMLEGEGLIHDKKPPKEGAVPDYQVPWDPEVCALFSLPPVTVGIGTLNPRDKDGA